MPGSEKMIGEPVRRTILGVLLALLVLVGLDLMRELAGGDAISGTLGVILVAISLPSILYLFHDGIQEGEK